jgi:type II secretion system protein E
MPLQDNLLIGQILIDKKLITPEQLEAGLTEQRKTGEFLCTTLVRLGFADEEKVFSVLSQQLGIPYVRLKNIQISLSVIGRVPAKFASHYKILPLELKENTLTVAMADPLDIRTLDDLKLLLGFEVKAVLSTESDILEAIRKYYGIGAETLEEMMSEKKNASTELTAEMGRIEDIEAKAQDASVVKFVNQILSEAIKQRATDVHLEPYQDELRVRFRIDGVLYDTGISPTIKYFHPAIVSRIKIMAHLNIAERRLPQDGRIKIRIADEELDLRVSVLPQLFGEAVHIRILSPRFFLELEKLGLAQHGLNILEEVIRKPHGIIFVTGPTGSGKSTTLYACLSRINLPNIKIITIEDPIEYQLRGVNQIQVQPKIGLSFATGLRHMLRHDPDVMMVGEVRDYETAEIAIRAALTGHLVFSTLHTNDACGTVTRLLDMGVEPFLVSSSLECLIAQRLVRLICPDCKAPIKPNKEILEQIQDIEFDAGKIQLYEGKGCKNCRFTGYRGRTGIYEILPMSGPIREMVLARASSQEIKKKAISMGMRTLRQDGLNKVVSELTTLAEVMRVTGTLE